MSLKKLFSCVSFFAAMVVMLLFLTTSAHADQELGKCSCVDASTMEVKGESCEAEEAECKFGCAFTPGAIGVFYPNHKDCNPEKKDDFEGLMGRRNAFRRAAFGVVNTMQAQIDADWAGLMGSKNVLEQTLHDLDDGGSIAEGIKNEKAAAAEAHKARVFGECQQARHEKDRWECCIKPGVEHAKGNVQEAFERIMGAANVCDIRIANLEQDVIDIKGSALTEIRRQREAATDQLGAVNQQIDAFPEHIKQLQQQMFQSLQKLWDECDCERKCKPAGDPKKRYGALLYCTAICEDGGSYEEFCGVEFHGEF